MSNSLERYFGLAGFRSALREFLATSEAICQQGGVTTTQYQALLAIGCSLEKPSITQLAAVLLLKHHSVVQLLDRLSKAGLTERMTSERDARVALIALTAKGQRRLKKLAELHLAEMLKQEPQLTTSLQRIKKQGNGN